MHTVLHEFVEVDALLPRDLGRFEEEVHEHGFPAPDLPHQVEAHRRAGRRFFGRDGLAAQEAGEEAALFGFLGVRVVAAGAPPQVLQHLRRAALRGVGVQRAGGEHRAVGWQRAFIGRRLCGREIHDRCG